MTSPMRIRTNGRNDEGQKFSITSSKHGKWTKRKQIDEYRISIWNNKVRADSIVDRTNVFLFRFLVLFQRVIEKLLMKLFENAVIIINNFTK